MGKPAKIAFDPKAFLAKVGAGKTILKFERSQHVFRQGDVADAVFYIQKGRVKLTVLSEQGKEAVVGILEPGQFFGEGCLNGHPLRIATTTAMEECVITSITKEAMIATLHTYFSGYQPGNIGRYDWNDTIPGELFHEQIPQAWTHQLQWKDRSSQFAVERRFA